MNVATPNPISNLKEQPMKPFARIILVSSLAREGRGKAKGEAR